MPEEREKREALINLVERLLRMNTTVMAQSLPAADWRMILLGLKASQDPPRLTAQRAVVLADEIDSVCLTVKQHLSLSGMEGGQAYQYLGYVQEKTVQLRKEFSAEEKTGTGTIDTLIHRLRVVARNIATRTTGGIKPLLTDIECAEAAEEIYTIAEKVMLTRAHTDLILDESAKALEGRSVLFRYFRDNPDLAFEGDLTKWSPQVWATKVIESLRERLKVIEAPVQAWKPIEGAPKDRMIEVYHRGHTWSAVWDKEWECWRSSAERNRLTPTHYREIIPQEADNEFGKRPELIPE